jgi:allophanate hydrolase
MSVMPARCLRSSRYFDPADAFARRFPSSGPSRWPPDLHIGVPRVADYRFFDDTEARKAFEVAVAALSERGGKIVTLDMAPFYETAQLLYEGPWVAERYVAARAIVQNDAASMHPVTRAIIEGATRFTPLTRSKPWID